jgi:hypothetical protein
MRNSLSFIAWKSCNCYGLDDRGPRVRFPTGAGNFSLHHHVQNGSGARPTSCPMVPGALSLGVKRPGSEADHSPPSSAEVRECVELYLHSTNTPLWHGAQLKKAQGQIYLYLYLYLYPTEFRQFHVSEHCNQTICLHLSLIKPSGLLRIRINF